MSLTLSVYEQQYCSAFTWNVGWIAVATNAFASCKHFHHSIKDEAMNDDVLQSFAQSLPLLAKLAPVVDVVSWAGNCKSHSSQEPLFRLNLVIPFLVLLHDDRHDDILRDLKGKPDSPPYCFYTKRLGSELVMKTLVGSFVSHFPSTILYPLLDLLLLFLFLRSLGDKHQPQSAAS